jgi:NADPH-dependent curcumin reductase CurA
MAANTTINRRIVLNSRPVGAPVADNFRLKEGRIKFREDIVDGLENAPEAFIGLLEGRNFGKLVIRVAGD